jgi:hypothetical protein
MRKDKQQAMSLRRTGKSYKEIRAQIGIPISTLSDWLRPHQWSQNIAKSLAEIANKQNSVRVRKLNKIRGQRLARLYKEASIEAVKEFNRLKYHPMFIAGIMLYWGEGDRLTKHTVRFGNTDPAMMRLFVNFLLHVCKVPQEKIKASVLLYPDLDEYKCRLYWSEHAGVPLEKFNKSILIQGRHKTRRLKYGVCSVMVCSTYLKKKMLIWLNLFPNELLSESYYKYNPAEVV